MALIKCYECEREISDKAPACPHCGAPKEALPPEIEEAEILESVAVVDEPEPITQETISAPSTEPEPVATKDERFNQGVAFAVGAFVFMIARALGVSDVSMAVYQASGELASLLVAALIGFILLAAPIVLLRKYGKKQSPQAYAGIIGALVVVFGIAIAAGPGDVFIQPPASTREVGGPTPPFPSTRQVTSIRSRAEQGDADAQYNLGIMYATGEGVPEDDAEAVRWYRLAAEQGLAAGQRNLGFMYGTGLGVRENDVLAYMWSNLSAAQGDETAQRNKDRAESQMTPEQIAEGQRLTREWIAAHPGIGN
jgi:hypothetical protein